MIKNESEEGKNECNFSDDCDIHRHLCHYSNFIDRSDEKSVLAIKYGAFLLLPKNRI